MEESEASLLGLHSDEWWARLSLASLVQLWSRSAHHFNSPSPRAGTDCVGHAILVMTDLDARATVLSVMADFGQTYFDQSDFGQFFDRLWPILGLTDFGQTDFGQF